MIPIVFKIKGLDDDPPEDYNGIRKINVIEKCLEEILDEKEK